MDPGQNDSPEPYMLVQGPLQDDLHVPIKNSARLKFNCISVSAKLVVLGANTGGVYVFSRHDRKLLQIAYADKETNAVLQIQLSPHEKFVAFSCGSSIHVLDLRLDSRGSKAETLRSSSDFGSATVTYLYWERDMSNSRLYIGDSGGNVLQMPVHSNKAMNLFSLPPEIIMKLDSEIVQIDKVGGKVLISTLTRCYLCDTAKQTYSQIGKKLRDGAYGACFLQLGMSAPMIYCARPGSRIWEVDFEGSVLNTHQFKQLLATPPVQVISVDREPDIPSPEEFAGQAVAFPRLVPLNTNLLLAWTSSALFVLDPVNVKVILWCNSFKGIKDICAVDDHLYIFLQSMEVQVVSFLPISSVLPLYMKASNVRAAAVLCIANRQVFLSKHVRKRFGVRELHKICDKALQENFPELAEEIKGIIAMVEAKTLTESGTESTDSSSVVKSRSGSVEGSGSVYSLENSENIRVQKGKKSSAIDEQSCEKLDEQKAGGTSDHNKNIDTKCDMTSEENSLKDNINEIHHTNDDLRVSKQLVNGDSLSHEGQQTENDGDKSVQQENHMLSGHSEPHGLSTVLTASVNSDSTDLIHITETSQTVNPEKFLKEGLQPLKKEHGSGDTYEQNDSSKIVTSTISDMRIYDGSLKPYVSTHAKIDENYIPEDTVINSVTPIQKSIFPVPSVTVQGTEMHQSEVPLNQEDEEDVGSLPDFESSGRRPSLTSISSMSSAEVTFDHTPTYDDLDPHEEIAIPVRKGKKKRRSTGDIRRDRPNRTNRSLSTGAIQGSPSFKEASMTPPGSVPRVREEVEEDSISLYSTDSLTLDDPAVTSLRSYGQLEDSGRESADNISLDRAMDTLSVGSPSTTSAEFGRSPDMTRSGDFTRSEEFSKSGDYADSGEYSRGRTSSSAPKTTLKNFREKVQSKGKNIVQKIKEKNLVSKAKGFMENLSHGSEAYLTSGEAPFMDTPSLTGTNTGQNMDITSDHPISADVSPLNDSENVLNSVLDFDSLREITVQTKNRLAALEVALNPDSMYQTLYKWITVLNEMFYEMHLQKYGVISEFNVDNSSATPIVVTDKLVATPNDESEHRSDDTEDIVMNNHGADSIGVDAKTGSKVKDGTIKPVVPGQNQKKNYSMLSSILTDAEFCYVKDPLSLPEDLLKNVSDLAQACFDLGCHGDISKYQHLIGQDQTSDTGDISAINDKAIGTSSVSLHHNGCSDIETSCENRDNHPSNKAESSISGCEIAECHTEKNLEKNLDITPNSNLQYSQWYEEGSEPNNELNSKDISTEEARHETKSDSELIGNSTSDGQTIVIAKDVPCDRDEQTGNSVEVNRSDQSLPIGKPQLEDTRSDSIEKCVISEGLGAIVATSIITDEQKHEEPLIGSVLDIGSERNDKHKNDYFKTTASNVSNSFDNSDESLREVNSINPVTVVADEEEQLSCQDAAMGYFVRCYFPYLQPVRVRQEVLSGMMGYQTWSGQVAAMEVLSGQAGERYGIDETSTISYLLEHQAPADQGAALLGHLSSQFRKKNASGRIELILRCHPYIQPLDVLYMSRFHGMTMDKVFIPYLQWIGREASSAIRSQVISSVKSQPVVVKAWLDMLLTEDWDQASVLDTTAQPRPMGHKVSWKNGSLVDDIISSIDYNKHQVLPLLREYGYWSGILRVLKQVDRREEHLDLILRLGDLELLNAQSDIGYLPNSSEEWRNLFEKFRSAGNQAEAPNSSDWSNQITWSNLAILLVRHVGPEEAVSLLEGISAPEGVLTREFYHSCLLAGMTQRKQRSIIHSMLEKVDTYLWSQRPVALSPQVHYLAVSERGLHTSVSGGHIADTLSTLTGPLKARDDCAPRQFVEDQECHWGVQANINIMCPCCGIPLKEAVSHEVPGVLLFKCGHGFHKLCLSTRQCLVCDS